MTSFKICVRPSKKRKFSTCNMTYHSVAYFEDFSGTTVRQILCIGHLNLKKKLWAAKHLQNKNIGETDGCSPNMQ